MVYVKLLKDRLHEIVQNRKPFLKHKMAQALIRGELSREGMAGFAKQWYLHARNLRLPTIYANVPRTPEYRDVIRAMVRAMVEEEGEDIVGGKTPGHPELAMRFAQSLGLSRDDVECATPLPELQLCDSELLILCKSSFLEGISAVGVALESHVPEAFKAYSESLRKNYGLGPESTAFWDVHVKADQEHGDAAEKIMLRFAKTPDDQARAIQAVKRALDAVDVWYDGMYRTFHLNQPR